MNYSRLCPTQDQASASAPHKETKQQTQTPQVIAPHPRSYSPGRRMRTAQCSSYAWTRSFCVLCQINPVRHLDAHASYLHAPDLVALCVLVLRAAHLPAYHKPEAWECYSGDIAAGRRFLRSKTRCPPLRTWSRWSHNQHALLAYHACSDCQPSPRRLREAMLSAAHGHTAMLTAVSEAFSWTNQTRASCVSAVCCICFDLCVGF